MEGYSLDLELALLLQSIVLCLLVVPCMIVLFSDDGVLFEKPWRSSYILDILLYLLPLTFAVGILGYSRRLSVAHSAGISIGCLYLFFFGSFLIEGLAIFRSDGNWKKALSISLIEQALLSIAMIYAANINSGPWFVT